MRVDEEEQRHAAEVRWWIKHTGGDHAKLKEGMRGVEKKRGREAADRLRQGIWEVMKRG